MGGIFILLAYGAPVVVITAAAFAGVFSGRFFKGHPAYGEERQTLAATLAPSIAILGCAAVLVPTIDEMKKLYGGFVDFLWLWTLLGFALGIVFGWTSIERPPPKRGSKGTTPN